MTVRYCFINNIFDSGVQKYVIFHIFYASNLLPALTERSNFRQHSHYCYIVSPVGVVVLYSVNEQHIPYKSSLSMIILTLCSKLMILAILLLYNYKITYSTSHRWSFFLPPKESPISYSPQYNHHILPLTFCAVLQCF